MISASMQLYTRHKNVNLKTFKIVSIGAIDICGRAYQFAFKQCKATGLCYGADGCYVYLYLKLLDEKAFRKNNKAHGVSQCDICTGLLEKSIVRSIVFEAFDEKAEPIKKFVLIDLSFQDDKPESTAHRISADEILDINQNERMVFGENKQKQQTSSLLLKY